MIIFIFYQFHVLKQLIRVKDNIFKYSALVHKPDIQWSAVMMVRIVGD